MSRRRGKWLVRLLHRPGQGLLADRNSQRDRATLGQYSNCSQDVSGMCHDPLVPYDVILVQDVSGSMTWKDCAPSRLGASVKAAEAFVRRRATLSPGDRIAIVTFNKYGRVVLPLTEIIHFDKILMTLSTLRGAGGTDLAEGLKAANAVFASDLAQDPDSGRRRWLLLLTDGRGGNPLAWAAHLKNAGVFIEVIGVGGNRGDVDERLLRQVATTDAHGQVHYGFFGDTEHLVAHYENLASGLVYGGHNR